MLKEPPAPPSVHETVPVGVVEAPVSISVTFTVKVIMLPITTEEGLGVMAVPVVRVFTLTAATFEAAVAGGPELSVT